MSAAYPQSFCMAEALPNASYRTVICAFDGSALTAEGGEVVAAQPATPATNADNAATPLAHSTSRREIAMAFVLGSMSTPFRSRNSRPPNHIYLELRSTANEASRAV